jgi:hypothetical protein
MDEKKLAIFENEAFNYLIFSYLLYIFNNLLVLTKICSENNNNVSYVFNIFVKTVYNNIIINY